MALLARFAAVTKVVVHLIDDIYDVQLRLSRPTELYGRHTNPLAALKFLLDWRSAEHTHLQTIARSLDAPYALLAMKHPADMLTAVIERPRDGVYLQHPIQAARCLGLNADTARQLQDEIAVLATRLRDDDPTLPVYEPTTIDELRFGCQNDDPEDVSLGPRFMHSGARPPGQRLLADADPLSDQERHRADHFFEYAGAPNRAAIDSVITEIQRQIRWRDLQYTIQSATQIAHRPFWAPSGEVAAGVAVESEYARAAALFEHELKAPDAPTRRLIVVHPPADERRRRIAGLTEVIHHHARLITINPSTEATFTEMLGVFADQTAQAPDTPAIVLGERLYERLTLAGAAVARPVSLDMATMANTHDRAFAALDRELTAFGRDIRAVLHGRFTTPEQLDAYGAYETSFLHSSAHYDTLVVEDAEQPIGLTAGPVERQPRSSAGWLRPGP